jgi:nicotinamide phosphoribosyltransferase
MNVNHSPIMCTDSYKLTHWRQYPPDTTKIYSYWESRGGKFPEIVGAPLLTYFIDKFLRFEFICDFITAGPDNNELYKHCKLLRRHFGGQDYFNHDGWERLAKYICDNDKLPIRIKAVPEGMIVPVSNVLMTIENTHPDFYWLPNYLETVFCQLWYPATVATLSREIKKVIKKYLVETGTPETVNFKLHDFGFRGATSLETAMIGGASHLINFQGTDTLPAIDFIQTIYGDTDMPAFSVAAAEHSTITSWEKAHEVDAYQNMLDVYPDDAIISIVADSYDVFSACTNIFGNTLKYKILSRKGTVVIRPDSGSPVATVLEVLERLKQTFGGTENEKGYFVLPPQVRVLQGDGIDKEIIENILMTMKNRGYSADNIVFGMGGALLQKVDRDTQKFAFKCSYAEVNGVGRPVFKDPVTDTGKRSKKGRLKLIREHGTDKIVTVPEDHAGEDLLVTYYDSDPNTPLFKTTFEEIRNRTEI